MRRTAVKRSEARHSHSTHLGQAKQKRLKRLQEEWESERASCRQRIQPLSIGWQQQGGSSGRVKSQRSCIRDNLDRNSQVERVVFILGMHFSDGIDPARVIVTAVIGGTRLCSTLLTRTFAITGVRKQSA